MRYSFESRCRAVAAMVAGMSPGAAAQAVGAGRATGYRWWRRYTTAGWVGLQERRSTPKHQPRRLDAAAEAEILAARTRSGAGPVTLGALLGRPASTVWARCGGGWGTHAARAAHGPPHRALRARPAWELLHLDTKQLGRCWHVGKRITRDGLQRSPRAGWLQSIPGIGPVAAAVWLAEVPDLGAGTRQPVAALVGVVPCNRDSGAWRGRRSCSGGRAPRSAPRSPWPP